jgi:hypothetical protein
MTAKLFFSLHRGVVHCIGDFEGEDKDGHPVKATVRMEVQPGEDLYGLSFDQLASVGGGVIEFVEPDLHARIVTLEEARQRDIILF